MLFLGEAWKLYEYARLVPAGGRAQTDHVTLLLELVLGELSRPLQLVMFGDFQCPPCANLADPINQLERDYGISHSTLQVEHEPEELLRIDRGPSSGQ